MPESNELYTQIASLRFEIEDMRKSVSAIARSTDVAGQVLQAMDKDPVMTEVFLLVDGVRTQKDILAKLKEDGRSSSQPTVSRKLDLLVEDWDLVRPVSRSSSGIVYVHTSLAKDLKIARALEKRRKR